MSDLPLASAITAFNGLRNRNACPAACRASLVRQGATTTTAAAVCLDAHDQITVYAPHGLDDLLDGVWRRNPTRVSPETSRQRLARHRLAERWPGVRVET
ncbi:nucleotidyltransferase family protein [Micromonospora sp. NPDC007220]|uniref:nucleotidyltransferase family protein n=1 Tax=Micromonospora sp. NPDC007220 TaxID=3154318 RepID=UPI0033C8E6D5